MVIQKKLRAGTSRNQTTTQFMVGDITKCTRSYAATIHILIDSRFVDGEEAYKDSPAYPEGGFVGSGNALGIIIMFSSRAFRTVDSQPPP